MKDIDKGYINGIFDGEGSVTQNFISVVSNTDISIINKVIKILDNYGIKYNKILIKNKTKNKRWNNAYDIRITNKKNAALFFNLLKDSIKKSKIKSWLSGEIRKKRKEYDKKYKINKRDLWLKARNKYLNKNRKILCEKSKSYNKQKENIKYCWKDWFS